MSRDSELSAINRGVAWSAVLCGFASASIGATELHSGLGIVIDLACFWLLAAVWLGLFALLGRWLLRFLPRTGWLVGLVIAAGIQVALLWQDPWGYWFAAVFVALECSFGVALSTLRQASRKTWPVVGIAAGMVANVGLIWFFVSPGPESPPLPRLAQADVVKLTVSDPSTPGPFPVRTSFYGHGDDLHRPEYASQVAIRTGTVDASAFLHDFDGWKEFVRRKYWGFGVNKLPLNARVWYPVSDHPAPLVLMVHGNHEMSEPSDAGYAYLGELLASRGFIFASIDENFLNRGLFHDPPDEQPVRAWLVLRHLALWHQWNAQPGNPFFGKIDLANIALIGHSRGGEAVATAALFNRLAYDPDDAAIHFAFGYCIRSVIAIAPTDGQYRPAGRPRELKGVNYLSLQGAQDGDVSSFEGARQWDRIGFTGNNFQFKADLYIFRANHGQFNTVWGRKDKSGVRGWLLNTRTLLKAEDQRKIAQVYLSAFLEATLRNRTEYIPLFRNWRSGRDWLPSTLYAGRFQSSAHRVLADFSEDADLTTATIPQARIESRNLAGWREGPIPTRNGERGRNGAFLAWNGKKGSYSIHLANGWTHDVLATLTLSVATTDGDGNPPSFSIALEDAAGSRVQWPISSFAPPIPPARAQLTKWRVLDAHLYKDDLEPAFQTISIPLDCYVSGNGFDPQKLSAVHLFFNDGHSGEVVLGEIGYDVAPLAQTSKGLRE